MRTRPPSGRAGGAERRGVRQDGYMLDHVSIQCADLAASAAFYDAVLAPLGGRRVHGLRRGHRVRRATPCRISGSAAGPPGTASASRTSPSPRRTAPRCTPSSRPPSARGAEVLHEPRVWPEYHASYYGAFVRDPDGNNVEAVCHAPARR